MDLTLSRKILLVSQRIPSRVPAVSAPTHWESCFLCMWHLDMLAPGTPDGSHTPEPQPTTSTSQARAVPSCSPAPAGQKLLLAVALCSPQGFVPSPGEGHVLAAPHIFHSCPLDPPPFPPDAWHGCTALHSKTLLGSKGKAELHLTSSHTFITLFPNQAALTVQVFPSGFSAR